MLQVEIKFRSIEIQLGESKLDKSSQCKHAIQLNKGAENVSTGKEARSEKQSSTKK